MRNIITKKRRERLIKTKLNVVIKMLEECEMSNDIKRSGIVDEIISTLSKVIESPAQLGLTINDIIFCIDCLLNLEQLHQLPSLKNSQLRCLFNMMVKLLKNSLQSTDINFVIKILGKIFSIRTDRSDQFIVELLLQEENNKLNLLFDYMNTNSSYDTLIAALCCHDVILNALNDLQLTTKQYKWCNLLGEKVLKLFYTNLNIPENCTTLFASTGLGLIHKIVALHRDFTITYTSELLGISKAYMSFARNGKLELLLPQRVPISQQYTYNSLEEFYINTDSEKTSSFGKKSSKNHKLRALEKNSNDRNISSSNMDRIPVIEDSSLAASNMNEIARVRFLSITLIGGIGRNLSRRLLYGYWHALFPNNICAELKNNILCVGQHDPNVRCRSAALQVCCQLLYGSKEFLHQAEFNEKRCPTNFMPFSVNLGLTVKVIYKNLINILATESTIPVIIQALKCLAVFVQSTPLEKLERQFLQDIINEVKPFVYHRNVAIQVSALMVMEFILASPKITNDVMVVVRSEEKLCTSEDSDWLLCRICHNLAKKNRVTNTVRIESLQVLKALSHHLVFLWTHLLKMADLLENCLCDQTFDVRLYAARAIEAIAFEMNRYVEDIKEEELQGTTLSLFDRYWIFTLDYVIRHTNDKNRKTNAVNVCLIDALSNIGAIMFERLPHSTQINLLTFLTGLSGDVMEESLFRSTCARSLAVYAAFPSLQNDLGFLENTAELTLSLVTDANVTVRIKTFWSLGNISDVLVNENLKTTSLFQGHNSNELLYRLMNATINACNDYDKVRCNATRTLGNLLRLLTEHHLKSNNSIKSGMWQQTFEMACTKLSDCLLLSGNAKVKWNTCYAVGNLLRNSIIFEMKDFNWQEIIYPALCQVLMHHTNFKVRTNASIAITNIEQRSYFGAHFESFWVSLLKALEQSNNLNNYLEYNHRDTLQEGLCLAMAHILRCSEDEDFLMLKSNLLQYMDIIRSTWLRVIIRMVPEKAEKLLYCSAMLRRRSDLTGCLKKEQNSAVKFLAEYFDVNQLQQSRF